MLCVLAPGDCSSIFGEIDKDGSGFIEKEEVQSLLELMWERPVQPSEIAEATEALDTNADGKVSFQEFSDWCARARVSPPASARPRNLPRMHARVLESCL